VSRFVSVPSGLAWHRSVYGRIALGVILLIAAELAVQGMVFLWLVARQARNGSEQPPALAEQLSAALRDNPTLNVDDRVAQLRPRGHVFVILTNGRVSGRLTPPESTIHDVTDYLARRDRAERIPAGWVESQYRAAPLTSADGRLLGVLGVVPLTTLEEYGPEMSAIGLVLLLGGIAVSTVLIFGPVRRRIQDLQRTAERLWGGDLGARATEGGSDEVAQLAHAFNTMADELGARADALATSDRRRRQLIADVSHELMTPLTAVLGHLETLSMEEIRLSDELRLRQVKIATREAKRLERLIGDLLEAARLEAGGGDLDVQQVATRELFDQVIAHHEYDCRVRNIKMVATVDPRAGMLEGDPFRLEQALENVTTNAIKHTPDGGVIQLRAERAGDKAVLTVADSGEGIAPEHLPLIFDRFYKTPSPTGFTVRGSGLGLSIVRAIVVRHKGSVSAESALGVGTTIRIELPVAEAPAPAEELAHPAR
jgi:signal transduction histidine kinase